MLTLLVASGLAAAAAQACNSGWSRNNDGKHYWAGGQSGSQYTMNGVDGHIYVTNPTVPNDSGTQGSAAWVGIETNSGANSALIQDGTEKLKNSGGTVHTFYQIANTTTYLWTGCPQGLGNPGCLDQNITVGNTYDFNVYYGGNRAVFDFAGVQKANVDVSGILPWANDLTAWLPDAQGEIQSYADQMPGTATNQELFSNLLARRYAGGGTTWYTTSGWSTAGFPTGRGSGNLNTFFNTTDIDSQVWVADNCLSS